MGNLRDEEDGISPWFLWPHHWGQSFGDDPYSQERHLDSGQSRGHLAPVRGHPVPLASLHLLHCKVHILTLDSPGPESQQVGDWAPKWVKQTNELIILISAQRVGVRLQPSSDSAFLTHHPVNYPPSWMTSLFRSHRLNLPCKVDCSLFLPKKLCVSMSLDFFFLTLSEVPLVSALPPPFYLYMPVGVSQR